jgi:hypothetical protein
MFTKHARLVAAGALLLLTAHLIQAQSIAAELARMQSDVDSIRITALERLSAVARSKGVAVCSPQARAEIRQGLIAALVKEEGIVFRAQPGSLSEAEADDYFGDLVGCVAALRDPEAVPALVSAIDTGRGATNGLMILGDTVVSAILRVLQTSTSRTTSRRAAAALLGRMLAPSAPTRLSVASVARVRIALLGELGGADPFTRSSAISSLQQFSDSDVRRAIESAAVSDTGIQIGTERKYLVRNAARVWLQQDSLRSRRPK